MTLLRFVDDSGRWTCKLLDAGGAEEGASGDSSSSSSTTSSSSRKKMTVKPTNLEPRVGEHRKHRLPSRARVLRHRLGAEIANAGDLVAPTFYSYSCAETCMEHHNQGPVVIDTWPPPPPPPRPPCPCVAGARPCLEKCPRHCCAANPLNEVQLPDGSGVACEAGEVTGATACLLAHLPVLKALTPRQLSARYDLACAERWGDSMGEGHQVEDDDDDDDEDGGDAESKKGTVSLRALLLGDGHRGFFDGCTSCCADGEQRFCFCLNRAVNANLVSHCFSCGKCFYIRHGTMRCSHCKALDPGTAEFFGREDESKWAWEIPDREEAALAAEGYWGF